MEESSQQQAFTYHTIEELQQYIASHAHLIALPGQLTLTNDTGEEVDVGANDGSGEAWNGYIREQANDETPPAYATRSARGRKRTPRSGAVRKLLFFL